MKKTFFKCLAVTAFALLTTTAFAKNDINSNFTGSVEPIKPAAIQLTLQAPNALGLAVDVENKVENEVIYQTNPISLVIAPNMVGHTKNPDYNADFIKIRLTNSAGYEIFNNLVYRRSTLKVTRVTLSDGKYYYAVGQIL